MSCDPQSCRDCEIFNFDLRNWSEMDDSIAINLKFSDDNLEIYEFDLVATEFSENYRECQIASTIEGVSCYLTKRIHYSCEALNFDFIIFYEQYDVLNDNPAFNDCLYRIEYDNVEESEHLVTSAIDVLNDGIKERLDSMETFKVGNKEYSNVSIMHIDSLITFETYQKVANEMVETKYIKNIIFKIPNGIVGLTLVNGKELILIKE